MSKLKPTVEDHGNGYMVIGTNDIEKAKRILKDYESKVRKRFKFAMPVRYKDKSCVWLTENPGAMWDGAKNHVGEETRWG